MRVESIRQWQWMALSIAIGLGIGYLRQQMAEDLAGQYGTEITSQARFEQSIENIEQGRHCFTDLSVHTRSMTGIDVGASKPVCIVSGLYFSGHYEPKDGKLIASWEPAFFVAPIPYRPATDIRRLGNPAASRFAAIRSPTVMDFLDCLGSATGIRYTRAWWQGMKLWQWVVASFISIGIAFPIVINLLIFGSWRRPAEEKGIDLSKVTTPVATAAIVPSDQDIDQLIAVTEKLEEELGAGGHGAGTPEKAGADDPVKELASAPAAAPLETAHADVTYGAKRDDYYPTAKAGRAEEKKQGR